MSASDYKSDMFGESNVQSCCIIATTFKASELQILDYSSFQWRIVLADMNAVATDQGAVADKHSYVDTTI